MKIRLIHAESLVLENKLNSGDQAEIQALQPVFFVSRDSELPDSVSQLKVMSSFKKQNCILPHCALNPALI